MGGVLQKGIYYLRKPQIGNSFCVIFLRIVEGSEASRVAEILARLWKMYQDLEKGVVKDLAVNSRHLHSGNIAVLIGYGPKIFSLNSVKKTKPSHLADRWLFRPPSPMGGGPILDGSGILYAEDIHENHAASDHIIIQLIADSEFATSRAVVETWRELTEMREADGGKDTLVMTRYYTGFQRPDGRSWLGFHDGVSNLKSTERLPTIAVSDSKLSPDDRWIANGTYLAFLRIAINLESWRNIDRRSQELIVGRDKVSGCPLIGVDKNGNPVKDIKCPVRGTFEVTEKGNEFFREHPAYGKQGNLPYGVSDVALHQSHIGMTRHLDRTLPWKTESIRIFRQGFSFLESIDPPPGFRAGLNFVSFQNSPENLFIILTRWLGKANFGGNPGKPLPGMKAFLNVRAAGIFLVPPFDKTEEFPGASIFCSDRNLLRRSRSSTIQYKM